MSPESYVLKSVEPSIGDEVATIPFVVAKGGVPPAIVAASVGLAEALEQVKPSPWTKRLFKLYFFLLIAFLNSCINGYDGSLMSGINAMDYYQK